MKMMSIPMTKIKGVIQEKLITVGKDGEVGQDGKFVVRASTPIS
jgi:predicted transcriptional regulator